MWPTLKCGLRNASKMVLVVCTDTVICYERRTEESAVREMKKPEKSNQVLKSKIAK